MCGISGIINKNYEKVALEEIKKINNLIKHRGPDDEGFYLEKNFAFGHRRLSIIDLTYNAHQPMEYKNQYVITYNGEIYNYVEIKEELLKEGYTFKSNSDTEVILASYDKWGFDCVNKFNGMWAFAIYDKRKNIIFCSRDRFGIKPFYYTEVGDKFIFGSEIKQLLEFYSERVVNKRILINYLVTGYEDYTKETFFENIFKLEQAHNLVYDLSTNKYYLKKYYDIFNNKNIFDEEQAIKVFKKDFYNSIKLRMRSDVKIGTCLSGGLDSSSIAAIASNIYSEKSNNKFIAIHAKSSEIKNDESIFAKEVSEYCNLDLKIINPSNKEFKEILDEVIYILEEPFGGLSIFMQYFVMKKAKEIGCKVMLDGQGADEILLGYERYYPAYLMNLGFFDFFKGVIMSVRNSKLSLIQLIQYFFYFTNSKLRLNSLIKKNNFLKKEYLKLIDLNIIENLSKNYFNIFNLQYIEIFKTQLSHLLKYEDKNSMYHSIETRLPFLDFNLVETTLLIDNKLKMKNGWTKYILRKAIEKKLPNKVVWRKNKFGFEAPTKNWLDSIECDMKEEIKNSIIINKISNDINFNKLNEKQKWKLFNIARWEKIFNVKIK
jgi:asparagine synthase (glutamine-hydrolysing)